MKKVLKVTKVTRVLKIADILRDILSDMSDEEVLERHDLSWIQLEKIYSKLFYGGYLSKAELATRVQMRCGRDASHIPLVDLDCSEKVYLCEICGFTSPFHFSACPRCRQVNLRRLTRCSPNVTVSSKPPVHYAGA
jgi:rubrerythrin